MSPEIERAGIPLWQKAAASGVASLDGDGKVVQDPATAYLPLAGGEMTGDITMAAAETVDGVDVSAHAANLAAHIDSLWRLYRTGQTHPIPPQATGPAGAAVVANTLYARPFFVVRPMSISAFAVHVSTGDAGSSARLGVYNDGTNLYPGTRVSDLGVVATATSGIKTITPGSPIAFSRGLYHLVLVSDGVPQFYGILSPFAPFGSPDVTGPYYGWAVAFTYDALPASFPEGASLTAAAAGRMGWLVTVSSLD